LTLLQFGNRDEPAGARAKAIAEALTVPGIDTALEPVIMQDMWQKWVSINTSAGMTCLMRASIGDIVEAGGTPLVLQLMTEAASIAAREGFKPTEEYLGTVIAKFTQAGSPFTASMLRDIEAGGPIEAFQIVGDMLGRGQKHGLATPLLGVVYAHLRCYEERRVRELNG
jgi:2-dehydropantoate 2-reductase